MIDYQVSAQRPCKFPSQSMKRAKYPMLSPMAVFGLTDSFHQRR